MEELEAGRNHNRASPRGPVSHPERGGAQLYGPAQQGHAGLYLLYASLTIPRVYVISIASDEYPVWRGQNTEAKI
jgi:hypothetical protein